MSISSHLPPAAADLVAAARETIDALHERLWVAAGDTDLLDVVDELAGLRAELAAIEAAVLVEIDHRHLPRTRLRWASTAEWLAHTAGLTKGQAKRTLRHAHDLVTDRTDTRRALRSAALSPTQASVICDGIIALPGDRMLRRHAETVLLDEATRLDATDLTAAARRVLDQVDPDHDDRRTEAELAREERAAHAERFFSLRDDGAGGVQVRGRGSVEDAAIIRAALLPLTKPEPSADPDSDGEPERDPRDHGARAWDALVLLAQHALDTDLPPTSHGTQPRVTITLPFADLVTATGRRSAHTDDGLTMSPAVVRRLACDAEVLPVVLGTDGEVLDVGRTHRTTTPAIWRALVTRDRHCAFPGCSRPPVMCHAHHVVHWADGGPTALHNLVLLCGHHHRTVHDTPWRVRLSPVDHHPEFLPPPRHRGSVGPGPWIRHRTRDHPRRE